MATKRPTRDFNISLRLPRMSVIQYCAQNHRSAVTLSSDLLNVFIRKKQTADNRNDIGYFVTERALRPHLKMPPH